MKTTPRVPGGRPLMVMGYKYNQRRLLGFISTEGGRSTEPGDPYLSCLLDIYSIVSVIPVVIPRWIGRSFNACNAIYNQNRIRHSDIALEQYWLTQSGYFILETTVELGMGIADGNILFYH